MPNWLSNTLRFTLAAALPVCLVLTNVRLMMSTAFVNLEYNVPGFPADPYGFTKEDRLQYSAVAVAYLLNDAGIEFLGDLTLPPEKVVNSAIGERMYNDRELKHMLDVKNVVRGALAVWMVSVVLVIGSAAALAWKPETRPLLRSGLLIGAGITVGLLLLVVLYVLVGFSTFFVQFHRVFFEGDTWLFNWYDTLIRLFPARFWQDAFIWIGGGALLEGLIVGAAAWRGLKGQRP